MAGKGPQKGLAVLRPWTAEGAPKELFGLKCRLIWQGGFDGHWNHVSTIRSLGLSHLVVFED